MKTELVKTLKFEATKTLTELHDFREAAPITEHSLSSAYLVDVNDYENLLERMKILEGIAKGEKAILEGHVLAHEQDKEKLGKWLK